METASHYIFKYLCD